MADDTQLPPQATGNTLPGQAADLADIAPAGGAENALLAANFGDLGALQYQNLRNAGAMAPSDNSAPAQPDTIQVPGGGAGVPAAAPTAPSGPPAPGDVGTLSKLLGGGGAFNPSP